MKITKTSEGKIFELANFVKVYFKTLPGRNLLTCSCADSSDFKKENPWCSHKETVIKYISTKKFKIKLKEALKCI